VIGATGVAIDITARRSAEHTNLRLMTAFEQSDESVYCSIVEGRIEYVIQPSKAFPARPRPKC